MTANSQKIPDWLFKCRDDQKLLPVPLGAVMPFPALLGAAGSAALLWANNSRWVFSVWSSVPVFVGTAGLLVLHDSLAARIAQRNSTNPRA